MLPLLSTLLGGLGRAGAMAGKGLGTAGTGLMNFGRGAGSMFQKAASNPNVQQFGSNFLSSLFNPQQNMQQGEQQGAPQNANFSPFHQAMMGFGRTLNNPARIGLGMLPQYAQNAVQNAGGVPQFVSDANIGSLGQKTGQHIGEAASNAFRSFLPQQFQNAQLGNLGSSMGDFIGSRMSDKWKPVGQGIGNFLGTGISSLFNQTPYQNMHVSQIPQHIGSNLGSMFDRNVTSRLPQNLQQSTLSTMGPILGNMIGNQVSRGMGYQGNLGLTDNTGLDQMPFAGDIDYYSQNYRQRPESAPMNNWNSLPFAGGAGGY